MRRLILILGALFAVIHAPAETNSASAEIFPPGPPREFRAAWLATVANIDWPSKPGLPVAQQKAELISLIDHAAQLNFNAIFFQVRPVGDAFYASTNEPWSEYLTGIQGRPPEPFYDPLALAITEAHKRGLQLHAWFNPFRAGHPQAKSPAAPNHVTRTHPEIIRHYGPQIWLDPGEPEAQARGLNAVLDVVKRYDVDGIVFDDYFYPYPEKNWAGRELDFPDEPSWKKFGLKTGLARDDWRRANVDQFIQKIFQNIKAAKPWVQFGISPFGIWRPQNPPQIRGLDAYGRLYADARKWLASGWVDYLAPQLYWPASVREQSFPVLFNWWRAQNPKGRHLYAALNDAAAGGKFPAVEISRQIQTVRVSASDAGAVHYHVRSILENPALAAFVKAQYAQPALAPLSQWMICAAAEKPSLTVDTGKNSAHVRWESPKNNATCGWVFQLRSKNVWATQIFPANRVEVYLDDFSADTIVLRGVDRLGNMGAPAIWTPRKYSSPAIPKGATRMKN